MTPQTKTTDQEATEDVWLDEQHIRQVEDRSRAAREVLADQQQERAEDLAPALFVP